jgi:hypothetical protein
MPIYIQTHISTWFWVHTFQHNDLTPPSSEIPGGGKWVDYCDIISFYFEINRYIDLPVASCKGFVTIIGHILRNSFTLLSCELCPTWPQDIWDKTVYEECGTGFSFITEWLIMLSSKAKIHCSCSVVKPKPLPHSSCTLLFYIFCSEVGQITTYKAIEWMKFLKCNQAFSQILALFRSCDCHKFTVTGCVKFGFAHMKVTPCFHHNVR